MDRGSLLTALRRIWCAWKGYASYVGDFQARLLLTIFYFTLALPFALVTILFTDPLWLRRRRGASTWHARSFAAPGLLSARSQF